MYKLEKHKKYDYVTIVSIPLTDISKIDFALCKQPTETLDAFYKRQTIKPTIMTNGGFFSMSDGKTCFGFRDEGKSLQFADYNGVGIVGNKTLSYGKNLAQKSQMRDFISAYPPLVEYGKKCKPSYATNLDYDARRTAFGWNDEMVFVITADSPGLRFSPLSDIFLELGAKFAINLDGGGSTRLLINGERKTSQVYARPVDNVLCIYLQNTWNAVKPDNSITNTENTVHKTLYRVQVGAFASKANAENLLETLKRKGFSDAYVKQVNNLYKVQVGAYSQKSNADNMRIRLQSMGYSPFITTN